MPEAADSNNPRGSDGVKTVTASPRFAPPASISTDAEEFSGELPKRPVRSGDDDVRYLQWLSIFYFIVGGLATLCATIPILHLTIGLGIVTGQLGGGKGPPPPPAMGWMFVLMGGGVMAIGYAFAIGLFVAGYMLRRRRHYVFCLVMAGIACMFQPMGVVLGVFTIIVLMRPGVKELFGRRASAAA
jgi:hypothetical protein